MNWLLAIFEAIKAGFVFGTKVAPSEKVQEDNHEIHRERLKENEYNKRLRSSKMFLDLHPLLQVDSYVEIRFNDLQQEDKENFRKALHEMFPHREQRGLKLKKDI